MKKGLIFGIIGDFFVGFQPIVANSRPQSLDALIFAAMTCLIEAIIFFPLMILELKMSSLKHNKEKTMSTLIKSTTQNWKRNFWLLIFIGFIFGINQFLFFIGYRLAGAINGSLTQKTTVFFGLIFGFLILKEKITKIQIIFSITLFFGLVLAITQGSFNLKDFNLNIILGVLTLLIITCLWMFGHTVTKPIFNREEASPTQMVFLRNILSGIILFIAFLILTPPTSLDIFLDPVNSFYFLSMGLVYGIGLFCWYKTLSYLDVSKATIIFSPTPIVTALFSVFLLNENFTIFHLIGTIIVILSIVIIVNQQKVKD